MSGSASADLEAAILGHTLGYAPMPAAPQVFVALCMASATPSEDLAGIEVSGGNYSRMAALFAASTSANIATNGQTVEFPAATSDWGAIGYFEIWTAATGGSRLYWGSLVDPADLTMPITEAVVTGDVMRFSPGTLKIAAQGTGTISGADLPTSTAGLAPGTLWNNGGFVCVA